MGWEIPVRVRGALAMKMADHNECTGNNPADFCMAPGESAAKCSGMGSGLNPALPADLKTINYSLCNGPCTVKSIAEILPCPAADLLPGRHWSFHISSFFYWSISIVFICNIN